MDASTSFAILPSNVKQKNSFRKKSKSSESG